MRRTRDEFGGYFGGLMLLLLCGVAVVSGMRSFYSEGSELSRMRRPLSQASIDEGRIRVTGVLVSEASDAVFCYVQHRYGRHYRKARTLWSKTISQGTHFLANGEKYELDTSSVVWAPEDTAEVGREREIFWRTLLRDPEEGWFEELCATYGSDFTVEGCVGAAKIIGGCGAERMTVTVGSLQARIDGAVSFARAQILLGGFFGLLILFILRKSMSR